MEASLEHNDLKLISKSEGVSDLVIYHKRSGKEGNHGYWNEHLQLGKRFRRKGIEHVDRYSNPPPRKETLRISFSVPRAPPKGIGYWRHGTFGHSPENPSPLSYSESGILEEALQ